MSAPDHQRIRMMLPFLSSHGWEATVLAVDPRYVEAPCEPHLLKTMPENVSVVRTRALSQRITRWFGFGGLAIRSFFHLLRSGDELLAKVPFDLVFFSTTEFGVLPLGVRWNRRFGIPFVVDLQDPWVNPYYREEGKPPPGGVVKHSITQAMARAQEGRTLKKAAAVISVSEAYPEVLRERHRLLNKTPFSVIPFGGSRSDFDLVEALRLKQDIFDPADGYVHWVYAGTAPPGIRRSLQSFFPALRRAFDAGILDESLLRIHFIGTDYADSRHARPRIMPIANEMGVKHVIVEHPARIPYLEALRCLLDAQALLVFGWDDPGYTASKIYPCILARKPLLSVLHERSSAHRVVQETNAGVAVTFSSSSRYSTSDDIYRRWFAARAFKVPPETDWDRFEQYSAAAMTQKVVEVFDRAIEN